MIFSETLFLSFCTFWPLSCAAWRLLTIWIAIGSIICIQNKNFLILTDDFVFFFGSSDIEWHWIGVFVFIYALIKSGRTNPFSEKSITSLSTWFNFLSTNKGTVYAQNINYSGVINVPVNLVAGKLGQMDVGDEVSVMFESCHQHNEFHELGPSIKNLVTNI